MSDEQTEYMVWDEQRGWLLCRGMDQFLECIKEQAEKLCNGDYRDITVKRRNLDGFEASAIPWSSHE